MQNVQLLVNRNDLNDIRWSETSIDESDLGEDQVLLAVDEFALTANNITYAVAGDRMGYWQFFPTDEGWGRVPVWGYATVVASRHADVAVGERVYGYLPMGSHLVITAGRVTDGQLTDVAAHRSELPPVYNQLQRVTATRDVDAEARQMLYRPLFMTSFVLDDFLAHNEFFGATDVILTSASSKTSLGLACLLAARDSVAVIGLTSPTNADFVRAAGCYSQVVTYDDIAQLDATRTAVSVDMAGNGQALADIHNHYRDHLAYSCLVGATHWTARAGARDMAGPAPELFFAPNHIRDRSREWGPGGLEQRFDAAWGTLMDAAAGWIRVEHRSGRDAVAATYRDMLAGAAEPSVGFVLSVA